MSEWERCTLYELADRPCFGHDEHKLRNGEWHGRRLEDDDAARGRVLVLMLNVPSDDDAAATFVSAALSRTAANVNATQRVEGTISTSDGGEDIGEYRVWHMAQWVARVGERDDGGG